MSMSTAIFAADMPGYQVITWKRDGVEQGSLAAILTHDIIERDQHGTETFRRVAKAIILTDEDDGIETPVPNRDSFVFPEYAGGPDLEWTLVTRFASEEGLWDLNLGA